MNLINDISIVVDQEKFLVISLKNTDQIEEYFNFQESNYTDINRHRKRTKSHVKHKRNTSAKGDPPPHVASSIGCDVDMRAQTRFGIKER